MAEPRTKVSGKSVALEVAKSHVEDATTYWPPDDSPHQDELALARAYLALREELVRRELDAGYAEHEAEEIVNNLECLL